jgi:FixJ family two-component response regulator
MSLLCLNHGLESQARFKGILSLRNLRSTAAHCGVAFAASKAPEAVLSEQLLISVVDDDRAFRDSMRRLLKSLGYAVAVFSSAAEFLASPKFAATRCLIADVHMPTTTGVELFRDLIERGQTIPTILVTAYPDESIQTRMVALGVECYLRKPLEEACLIDCIRSAFARGNAPRTAS